MNSSRREGWCECFACWKSPSTLRKLFGTRIHCYIFWGRSKNCIAGIWRCRSWGKRGNRMEWIRRSRFWGEKSNRMKWIRRSYCFWRSRSSCEEWIRCYNCYWSCGSNTRKYFLFCTSFIFVITEDFTCCGGGGKCLCGFACSFYLSIPRAYKGVPIQTVLLLWIVINKRAFAKWPITIVRRIFEECGRRSLKLWWSRRNKEWMVNDSANDSEKGK